MLATATRRGWPAVARRPLCRTSTTNAHWLDARFPRASAWLLQKSWSLWMEGLRQRARLDPHRLNEHFIIPAVESRAAALATAFATPWAADPRGRAHVQTAALAVATGTVLAPFLRDDAATLAIVADSAGAKVDPVARSLLRAARWISRRPPLDAAAARMRALLADKGSAADGEVSVDADSATMTIRACAAAAVCGAAHKTDDDDGPRAERWLPALCCSAERALLEGVDGDGLVYERLKWLGAGDGQCVVRVRKA